MFVSFAFALLAASSSAANAVAPAPPPAEAPAKVRRICRSEALIGSVTPKRVCTVVPPRNDNPQARTPNDKARPAADGAGGEN